MKIVIPMAGEGSRFVKEGYKLPKPLINVNGKPMIQRVVENLQFDAEYVFLVRKSHILEFSLDTLLKQLVGGSCSIVPVDSLTEGAACTVLLAEDLINSKDSLLIANADQYVEYDKEDFIYRIKSNCAKTKSKDYIWTFEDSNPKWSFAANVKLNDKVLRVAEKKVISKRATCGVYYWNHGEDFISCAKEMIDRNERVNGEFYICPVYNTQIIRGKDVYSFQVKRMWGLGTPEDLEEYLRHEI